MRGRVHRLRRAEEFQPVAAAHHLAVKRFLEHAEKFVAAAEEAHGLFLIFKINRLPDGLAFLQKQTS